MKVAVIIPALDEEASLPAVLTAIPRDGDRWQVREVVVADNGSHDRTAEVARTAGATVVSEPRRGYGSACLAALAHLKPNPPDIVAFMDADGSDDPTELGALLTPILEGHADLVIGSRTLGTREPGSLTPVQEFGNRLACSLLKMCFGVHTTDLGPFRAIGWRSLESLAMRDRDYGWTVEMQARAARARLRAVDVPVRYRNRRAGFSKIAGSLRGALAAGTKILWTIGVVRLGG